MADSGYLGIDEAIDPELAYPGELRARKAAPSSQMRLCLGYDTALRIGRTLEGSHGKPQGTATYGLPPCAPRDHEMRALLSVLKRSHLGGALVEPVEAVVGARLKRSVGQGARFHACTVPLAGRAFLPLGQGVFLCAPPLAFVQMATKVPGMVELCEWGFEVCGTYQTQRTASGSAYQVPPLAKVATLRRFAERNPSLDGARKAASALRFVGDGAASPREAKLALLLGLPHRYGGYGLGMPQMDYEVRADGPARALAGRGSFRCDLCWPEARLDVEYQSREMHGGESSRLRDSRRTNALLSMGWQVVGVTHTELDGRRSMDAVARAVRQRLGLRSRVRTSGFVERQRNLRRQLRLPAD